MSHAGTFKVDYEGDIIGGKVHLGKRSGGWKFLWNPNIYIIKNSHLEHNDKSNTYKWIPDPDTYYYLYPLTREGIWDFLSKNDIEVYNEYGKQQDKKEFFNMALNWVTWRDEEAWDSKSYTEFEKSRNPDWHIYKCSGNYIDMLEKEGYTFISEDKFDFYSDGLRFATTTEFA